jgi:hypothetical protein
MRGNVSPAERSLSAGLDVTRKLTLSVERAIIDKAKRYAQEHNRSLSEIVAKYLDYLTGDAGSAIDIDPAVLDLSDEIPVEQLGDPDDVEYGYLRDKYLHG